VAAYSFEDVQATISGPGGTIPLGAGSANAQEGITVEFVDNKNAMTIGADGEGVHSLRATRAARIIVRLLKTSPVNAALNAQFRYQSQSSAFWGQNVINVSNPVTGDDYQAAEVAYEKHPAVTWAQDANYNEWAFNAIKCDPILGVGF
jgi:phosphopantothenoylcysteine synthetase/decarboxylase